MPNASTDFAASQQEDKELASRLAEKPRLKAETAKQLVRYGPIEAAKFLVGKLFEGIKYGNRPYYEHLEHVGEAQRKRPGPLGHRMAAAYMHDLLEDIKGWEAQDLLDIGFTRNVIDMIQAVTKKPGENYFNAMQRLSVTQENGKDVIYADAIYIKLADLGMNSNAGGLPQAPNEKDLARMQKYWLAQRYLEAVLNKEIAPGSCPHTYLMANIDKFGRNDDHKLQLMIIIEDNYTFPNTSPPQQELKVA